MLNGDIVDEVRTIREAHAAKFNYDLRAIFEDFKRSESERLATGHPFLEPPAFPVQPNSRLQQIRFARWPILDGN